MRQARMWIAIAVAILAIGPACVAQSDDSGVPPAEQRLAVFADRVQLGLSSASVAAFSPALSDARAQAERLISLLRGDARDPLPGLLSQAELLFDWILGRSFDPETRQALLGAAANVHNFLRLALEAAISANRDRTLASATQDLLRVYAFLLAAWGEPVDGIVVPGLVMLLRAFDVPTTN